MKDITTDIGKIIKKRAVGGGRKLKYSEESQPLVFRCPKSKKTEFKKSVYEILEGYKV